MHVYTHVFNGTDLIATYSSRYCHRMFYACMYVFNMDVCLDMFHSTIFSRYRNILFTNLYYNQFIFILCKIPFTPYWVTYVECSF